MHRTLLLCVLTALAADSAAAPAAAVKLLQAPAWRERAGVRVPLRPALDLASGDIVHTGPQARVLLRLEEGSVVKIGADASVALESLQAPPTPDGVFSGVLDVIKGAFRFTTTLASRQRDIRARVRSATIGIRGTDVWGKAEDARDFVVLLEGRIEIERDGRTYALDRPLSLFMAPRGAPPEPVAPAPPDELALWAQETEPQPGHGVVEDGGRYRLHLASLPTQVAAQALVERLASAGRATDMTEVEVGERRWWRVSIGGYSARADAEATMAALARDFALGSPWIERSP